MSRIVEYDTNALTKVPWNPVTGCSPISPGCENCLITWTIKNLSRFPQVRAKYIHGTKPTVHHSLLKQEGSSLFTERAERRLTRNGAPLAMKLVATCTLGDLYHPAIPDQARDMLFMRISGRRQVYFCLTKYVSEMVTYWSRRTPPSNWWQGCSIETCDYLFRADQLFSINFAKRIIALEPMLSPFPAERLEPYLRRADWLICGLEYGHALVKGADKIRPGKIEWVENVVRLAHGMGLPVLIRSLGGLMKAPVNSPRKFIDGKRALLMGRTWRECPDPNEPASSTAVAA